MKKTVFIALFLALNLSLAFASTMQPEKPVLNAVEQNYELSLTRLSNHEFIFRLLKEEGDVFKVRVMDSDGNRLYCHKIKKHNKSKTTFDISEFPTGEYTFHIVRNNKVLYTEKIEKK